MVDRGRKEHGGRRVRWPVTMLLQSGSKEKGVLAFDLLSPSPFEPAENVAEFCPGPEHLRAVKFKSNGLSCLVEEISRGYNSQGQATSCSLASLHSRWGGIIHL